MLNRKDIRASGLVAQPGHGKRGAQTRAYVARRRFVLPSAKRKGRSESTEAEKTNGHAKPEAKANSKASANPAPVAPGTNAPAGPLDLTETIKTLLHLAQEHGY